VVSVTPRLRFSPWERTPSTHCTGGWVGPRVGLNTETRGKILSLSIAFTGIFAIGEYLLLCRTQLLMQVLRSTKVWNYNVYSFSPFLYSVDIVFHGIHWGQHLSIFCSISIQLLKATSLVIPQVISRRQYSLHILDPCSELLFNMK
jgi:hypothetical protein